MHQPEYPFLVDLKSIDVFKVSPDPAVAPERMLALKRLSAHYRRIAIQSLHSDVPALHSDHSFSFFNSTVSSPIIVLRRLFSRVRACSTLFGVGE